MNGNLKKFTHLAVFTLLVVAVMFGNLVSNSKAATINPGSLVWSVHYLIDQSQSVFEKSQFVGPRDNRGLALSPDGRYLYAGYNNPTSEPSTFQVRKIDTTIADYINATVAVLPGYRGKAIATDDLGRVYLAEGTKIAIYDSNLATSLWEITGLTLVEGVAVTRENGTLVLYATDRSNKTLTRYEISEGTGVTITGYTKTGLDGDGEISITGASNLRGVEVDPAGRIWMADISANKVFRVNTDGSGLVSVSVIKPIDIAFDNTQAFVTQYTSRTIIVLNQSDMSLVTTLTPPWAALVLDSDGQSAGGALSGIAMGPGQFFYVANEAGQTANEKSTYGRCDEQSDNPGGPCTYTDLTHDDNDPILKALTPNAPPSVDAGGPYSGDEGSSIAITGTASDPDLDPLTFAWSYAPVLDVDPGATCAFANASALTTTITCTDDGTYNLTLTVADGVNPPVTDTAALTVANLPPDVSITSPAEGALFEVNTTVDVLAPFTDPGSNDTHTCLVDWDDTTTDPGSVAGGACSASHVYTMPGVYTIDVTVTDDDSGQDTASVMVVVFDPNAGFVTGGGWIWSTQGDVEGKANFGFVAKYKKGTRIPEGETEFMFQPADLNFHSSGYDWLVIRDKNAQFTGKGTINGGMAPNGTPYRFTIWAVDNAPDTFRIKIWYVDGMNVSTIYDSSVQPLGGGSIVVHKQ